MLGTAVIFDLDGVLVDSRAAITTCLNGALAARGRATRPPEELYQYIGPPQSGAFADLLGEPEGSPAVLDAIAAYRELYARDALAMTPVFAGIAEALDALAAEHRLAVATSKILPFAESLLTGLGLRDRFAAVAGPPGDTFGETKTATLARALEALGPVRAVMVGDRSFDMVAAAAHGLPGIGAGWGIGSREELRQAGAGRILAAPAELPQAVAEALR